MADMTTPTTPGTAGVTEYLVMLTVETQRDSGVVAQTHRAAIATVPAGATRFDLLGWARAQLPQEHRDGVILFFYAEPNRLGGGAS
ncbi:hypothetical protein [Actinomadura terrae]|uniref:hypothetical protein n=1 Tax=Actinomadura terrae TaxID=604353 RepID=UPI001FA6B8B4|nr:hypothetical protein [Actinomadura terrae]